MHGEGLCSRRRYERVLAGALLTLATTLAFGVPAHAQLVGDVDLGISERSTVPACTPGGGTTTGAQGAVLVDKRPKQAGEVFYAAALVAPASNCFAQVTTIEVVPPVGVELAISAATPVLCKYDDSSGPPESIGPAEGCPQQALAGAYGFLLNRTAGPKAPLWDLLNKEPLQVSIPLRASRALAGLPSLSCGRTPGVSPPCRREQVGDNLQVGYYVSGATSTWLVPNVGLTVAAAPAVARVALAVPRVLRMRRALRGIPVTVKLQSAAVVRVRIGAARLRGVRRGLIASATRRARAGTIKLRLRPSRRAARALRRKRRVVATVRVTATPSGGTALTASARVTLRR